MFPPICLQGEHNMRAVLHRLTTSMYAATVANGYSCMLRGAMFTVHLLPEFRL